MTTTQLKLAYKVHEDFMNGVADATFKSGKIKIYKGKAVWDNEDGVNYIIWMTREKTPQSPDRKTRVNVLAHYGGKSRSVSAPGIEKLGGDTVSLDLDNPLQKKYYIYTVYVWSQNYLFRMW